MKFLLINVRFLIAAPVLSLLAQSPCPVVPPAPKRFALILANADYAHLERVDVAIKDANLIDHSLRDAGFKTQVLRDFDPKTLDEAEKTFTAQIRSGDVAVVYYAGYVLQSGDVNYIVPVDYDPAAKSPVGDRAYALNIFQQDLDSEHVGLQLLLMEPLRIETRVLGASAKGVAVPSSDSLNTALAWSLAPNQTFKESGTDASTFTRSISDHIAQIPGLPFEEVFNQVKRDVAQARPGGLPMFWQSNFSGDFYFHEPEHPIINGTNRWDRERYVLIAPAKAFMMGCVTARDKLCSHDEEPQHPVCLTTPFWMGQTEVTVDAYLHFVQSQKEQGTKTRMPAAPLFDKKWEHTDRPVVNLNWEDAGRFCNWLGGRLPTEAEWEFAARAGKDEEVYPLNSENSRDKANFDGTKGNDNYEFTAPVGKFDPNAFGLFDMAGNVWEWVSDFYSPHYYEASPTVDPKGPPSGKEHVIRGGSWNSDPVKHLRISIRRSSKSGENNIGFRCVASDDPEGRQNNRFPIQ